MSTAMSSFVPQRERERERENGCSSDLRTWVCFCCVMFKDTLFLSWLVRMCPVFPHKTLFNHCLWGQPCCLHYACFNLEVVTITCTGFCSDLYVLTLAFSKSSTLEHWAITIVFFNFWHIYKNYLWPRDIWHLVQLKPPSFHCREQMCYCSDALSSNEWDFAYLALNWTLFTHIRKCKYYLKWYESPCSLSMGPDYLLNVLLER